MLASAGYGRTFTTLLAASVLAAGMMPPAVQHAHADGRVQHDHQSETARHRHTHAGDHEHTEESDAADRVFSEAPTLHRHVTFLGFDLTLPVPQPESDADDRDHNRADEPVTLVRVLDDPSLIPRGDDSSAAIAWRPACGEGSDRLPQEPRPSFVSRGTVLARVLCDAARGARSGVQLI